MPQLARDASRVWIEGVPDGRVGEGWDMLLRGMLLLLEHRGEAATLEGLMGLSGDAFNLCFASHWHATAYLGAPTDTLANAADALGYEHRWLLPMAEHEMRALPEPERRRVTDQVLQEVREQIDEGRPVLVGGCADRSAAWSVAVGYDTDAPALCHVGAGRPYRWEGVRGLTSTDEVRGYWEGAVRGAARPGFVGGWMADPAFLLGPKGPEPPARGRAVDALRRAVRAFGAPYQRVPRWGGITYYFGRQAYAEWARALRELDYPADLDGPRPEGAEGWYEMRTMGVLVDAVVRGRNAAADYCEALEDLLTSAKANLGAAARFYRREVSIAGQAFHVFLHGTEEERAAYLADPERREAGAQAVEGMLDRERSAVREIELALNLERSEVPAAFTHAQEPLVRARKQPFGPTDRSAEESEQ